MNPANGCRLIGRWRIVKADIWDRDYLDVVEPAHITFDENGRGEFAFGVLDATMELDYAKRTVFFTWSGFDEGDEISGIGISRSQRRRHDRNRAILPQRRRCRPQGSPRLTSSTAC
jgi:hypothetical protein